MSENVSSEQKHSPNILPSKIFDYVYLGDMQLITAILSILQQGRLYETGMKKRSTE